MAPEGAFVICFTSEESLFISPGLRGSAFRYAKLGGEEEIIQDGERGVILGLRPLRTSGEILSPNLFGEEQ
ncbi:hypothetical protein K1719_010311 [Acacia pycnantha]|nr:hypothetical protein K1719_010311 [Acacia pycnantha]